MRGLGESELLVIRHAPAMTDGRLAGRRDVPAQIDPNAARRLGDWLGPQRAIHCSPALRCRQTAAAIWPEPELRLDPRLWEQDFGTQEGMAYDALPDLGTLNRAELAEIAAPKGESFAAMVARVHPALRSLSDRAQAGGPVVVVAHAGTARAALAMALEDVAAALAFEIAPLSVTRLRCLSNGFSIIQVAGTV